MRVRLPVRFVALAVVVAVASVLTACGGSSPDERATVSEGPPLDARVGTPTTAAAIAAAPTTRPVPTTVPLGPPVEAPAMPLRGCPPPPRPPGTGVPAPPYRPPVLVPESELPEALPPGQWTSNLAPLEGKGMWLWKYFQSEGGNADAIVAKAEAAGLNQLWVRVGDSADKFYAGDVLEQLVPRAHRKGIAVIGWGFPYLFDPVGDAQWSAEAINWRSRTGEQLDGFSPDLELQTEGVAVSEKRTVTYLGLVRKAAGSRLVVATVYRPMDRLWPTGYHYAAIAPYVDAFAPMVYWNCLEPGALTLQALERLKTLRPVHTIGQAWNPASEGGRQSAPDSHETRRFLDVSRRNGALGASFWVWHFAPEEQWQSLSAFPWPTTS